MSVITEEDIGKALDRIARTADGVLLYRYLQKELMGVPGASASELECSVLVHHGRRSFARDLMTMLTKGIEESGGTDRPATGAHISATERPVIFALKPAFAAGQQPRGAGRRVSIEPGEPGFRALPGTEPS